MVFHMKTTLIIDDTVMTQLREEAARQGRTISELVDASLRMMLERGRQDAPRRRLPALPSFTGGRLLVDVANREALQGVMDEE